MKTVTLNAREQQRLMVLNRIREQKMTIADSAGLLGLSARQVRRLLAGYRVGGAAALAHGSCGRPPIHYQRASEPQCWASPRVPIAAVKTAIW